MADWEKLIIGLECCMAEKICASKCPYKGQCDDGGYYYSKAIEDTISLLKALKPRVLTLEEVETAELCMEPVFVEMLDENGKPQETPDLFSWRFVRHITPLTDGKIYVLNNIDFSSALYEETYSTTWRCWTSRPTDEQREAVKWNE